MRTPHSEKVADFKAMVAELGPIVEEAMKDQTIRDVVQGLTVGEILEDEELASFFLVILQYRRRMASAKPALMGWCRRHSGQAYQDDPSRLRPDGK